MDAGLRRTERIMIAAALACAALALGLYLGSAGGGARLSVTPAGPPAQQTADTAAAGLIDLNTAAREELTLLPGIGEKKAAAITEYREEHGSFSSIEEIMEVEGVGPGIFENIKNYITVGDAS